MPNPPTKVNDGFRDRVEEIARQAKEQLEALENAYGIGRPWMVPSRIPANPQSAGDEWTGNPREIEEISKAFTRKFIEEEYRQSTEMPVAANDPTEPHGRVGHLQSLKTQMDYLATIERAFRARHESSIRCRVWAQQRRGAHGMPGSLSTGAQRPGVFARLVDQLDQMIRAATVELDSL